MGIVHGAWCLGCCWILMALLFVGGVMNLLWVAAIALFVLLEKALPLGDRGGRLGDDRRRRRRVQRLASQLGWR
jgi:predicted metal-binding membrane protein